MAGIKEHYKKNMKMNSDINNIKSLKFMPEKEYLKQNICIKDVKGGSKSNSVPFHLSDNENNITNCAERCCDSNYVGEIENIISNTKLRTCNSTFDSILDATIYPNPTEINNQASNSIAKDLSMSDLQNTLVTESVKRNEYCNFLNEVFDPKNSSVDLYTHKGVYLGADCSCKDDECLCLNCLLHRKEDELDLYIQNSGIPLTSLKNNLDELPTSCPSLNCSCTMVDCACIKCPLHPTEIGPFEKFYCKGLLNLRIRRKTLVKFKGKLIPSDYWWDLINVKIPLMTEQQLECIDLKSWFNDLWSTYKNHFLDAETENFPYSNLEGFYVL